MDRGEAEKNSFLQLSLFLAHFSLSAMYEVVGEAVLPNSFFKTAKLHRESCS